MSQKPYPPELDHTIEEMYGRPRPPANDAYGLEIEAEGVPEAGLDWPRYLPQVWQTHRDDSLRGGIEFVSNGGRAFGDIPKDLAALQTSLQNLKFTPVFSYRTSLHVHMNVQNMTYRQVLNLFTLYTIFEIPMVDFGGEERRGNVHCLTVHDTNWVIETVRDWMQQTAGRNALGALIHRDRRYAAFNWASIPLHGTVEFRSHRGTADKDVIVQWVTILNDLKRVAMELPDPQTIIQLFSQLGVEAFTREVFQNSPAFLTFLEQYNAEIWEGVRLAQEVAYSRSEWFQSKPAKKKRNTKNTEAEPAQGEIRVGAPDPWVNWARVNVEGVRLGDARPAGVRIRDGLHAADEWRVVPDRANEEALRGLAERAERLRGRAIPQVHVDDFPDVEVDDEDNIPEDED